MRFCLPIDLRDAVDWAVAGVVYSRPAIRTALQARPALATE